MEFIVQMKIDNFHIFLKVFKNVLKDFSTLCHCIVVSITMHVDQCWLTRPNDINNTIKMYILPNLPEAIICSRGGFIPLAFFDVLCHLKCLSSIRHKYRPQANFLSKSFSILVHFLVFSFYLPVKGQSLKHNLVFIYCQLFIIDESSQGNPKTRLGWVFPRNGLCCVNWCIDCI